MKKFQANKDCLSSISTQFIIKKLRPRAVFGGHTHYGCKKWLVLFFSKKFRWKSPHNFWEYTVPSFSWRNNRRPSFILASISPSKMDINQCFLPDEYYLIISYIVFFILWSSIAFFFNFKKFLFKLPQKRLNSLNFVSFNKKHNIE